ncbi:hypothetical protein BC941DRAFT_349521 [Chlamydoabsidia padenii]|nr:hypothetical protein BC941DRAFT_349521 [Chlamydoabsidia padenii]
MVLKYNGGFLKDDQATLESLGILPWSELVVLGDQVLNEQVQQIASGNEEEVGQITRIRHIMKEPVSVSSRVTQLEQGPIEKDEIAYLSEVVMRALLALDGIECASSFTTARQERRQAVGFCQSLLDRVDALKSTCQQQQKL